MPIVQHGPRGKREIALTFDADLTISMRKRLRNGKVRSYYNDALITKLRELHVPATLPPDRTPTTYPSTRHPPYPYPHHSSTHPRPRPPSATSPANHRDPAPARPHFRG